jgi:UDP-3-O-[3-hydroxymyristoyl] glucosamine N-acyltransferase
MTLRVGELAKAVGGKLDGDKSVVITGVSSIYDPIPGTLTLAAEKKYLKYLRETTASCVIIGKDLDLSAVRVKPGISIIRVENPVSAFEKAVQMILPAPVKYRRGIHKTAVISKTAKLSKNISLGPHCVLEDFSEVRDGSTLIAGVYVGRESKIGRDCLIYPNVTIRERVTVGDRVIIHSGSVLGSDGFGYRQEGGRHVKIVQLGTVEIADDVEIGACVTIARARFARTFIGSGTKIDNLVHIAHNVVAGSDCLIIAQVGIAGSTKIGRGSIIAGQAGIDGHLELGESVRVAGKSGVTQNVRSGETVSGYPAQPHIREKRCRAAVRRLPELLPKVKELEERLNALENPAKNYQKTVHRRRKRSSHR